MKSTRYPRIAFRSPDEIEARQSVLLREHVRYCINHSPYYKKTLSDARIPFEAPMGELLAGLPLTDKHDLEKDNDEFRAVALRRVIDIVTSSGTTGQPTRIPYTEHDLKRLAYNEAKSFIGCGLTRDDVILLTCTLDRCFIAGLAYFLGARYLGAASIRNGHDTLEGYAGIIRRHRPTALVGVPSFIRKMGGYLREAGLNPAAASIRRIVAIGEPVRGRDMKLLESGREIEETWGACVYSTYASSETVTTFCECVAQQGGHLHPDLAVLEIIDDDGNPLPNGKIGEVVLTPLGVEGMPLIRFRTGDLTFRISGPCPCGRNSVRLGPILGRRAQMLKVQGTTLYPPSILAALAAMEEVSDYYVSAHSDTALSDRITVHVTLKRDATICSETIASRLRAQLRVRPAVLIEPENTLRKIVYSPASRKPVRFVDRRGI